MLQNASGKFLLPTAASMTAEAKQLEAKTPANETLSMIFDKAAGGYPIVNYEYAIIPGKELNNKVAQAVRAFLYWAVDPTHGSNNSFLNQVDFQPLTPAVVSLSDVADSADRRLATNPITRNEDYRMAVATPGQVPSVPAEPPALSSTRGGTGGGRPGCSRP